MTSVVLPAPEGPTKATVSPARTSKLTPWTAGVATDWWEKETFSKASRVSSPTSTGSTGRGSRGASRIAWKFASDTSASR